MSEVVEQGHLGGYIAGGDPACWFPDMWAWIVKELKVKSVLDVGCGEGHSTREFTRLGCRTIGIDGVGQPEENEVIQHDLTERPYVLPYKLDMVWTCEFVEHLEEKYGKSLAVTLGEADTVVMTHAFPGQAGYHHVNCRDSEYWKGFMAGCGLVLDERLTEVTRSIASLNTDVNNHYKRSGMVFRKLVQ